MEHLTLEEFFEKAQKNKKIKIQFAPLKEIQSGNIEFLKNLNWCMEIYHGNVTLKAKAMLKYKEVLKAECVLLDDWLFIQDEFENISNGTTTIWNMFSYINKYEDDYELFTLFRMKK